MSPIPRIIPSPLTGRVSLPAVASLLAQARRAGVGVKIRMALSAKRIAKKTFSRRSALCFLRYAIRSPSPLSPPAKGGERSWLQGGWGFLLGLPYLLV